MHLKILYFLLIFIVISFFQQSAMTQVVHGTVNLKEDILSDEIIDLNGNWEIYWDTLLSPENFKNQQSMPSGAYIPVPASWTSKKAGKHSSKGKATYRLELETGKLQGLYGIRLYDIFTASKVWFDNRLIYSTGEVAKTALHGKPGFSYKNIPLFLNNNSETHELVIQVSNYEHTRGGLVKPVTFGQFDQLTANSKELLIINLIIVGIILIIGFNHLLYFFLRRNERSNLFFGLLCLVMILRNVSTGERIINFVFPNINWELLFKMDNFSGFGTIPLFALFLFLLFRKEFPKVMLYILVSIGTLISLFVFVTPQLIYGRFRMFYELYILFGGLYLTFGVLLRAAIKGREGGLLSFIGFFLLYGTAINDVLVSMGIAHTPNLAPYGLATYMLIQSFILSRRSASAINDNEHLSAELQHEKQMLEGRVAERTMALEKQNEENSKHKEEIQIQSWISGSLNRVNAVLNNHKDNLKQLSQRLIAEIVGVLDANLGGIYLLKEQDDDPVLELTGSYNAPAEMLEKNEIFPGEGLVGACFKDLDSAILRDIPENYFQLASGLGDSPLKHLILVPLKTDAGGLGVIEVASLKPISHVHVELLEKIAGSVASTILFSRMNEKNLHLLNDFTRKQEEFDLQEEEMRGHLDELRVLREEVESFRKKGSQS
ncbi:MAG TPA: 7TM diverse intracellular signaling domain-containing protein [Bacteroidales bacterium]|nr:7TM diverse intracellular signaling domain-containing protein [Bacteroidales bacterium]